MPYFINILALLASFPEKKLNKNSIVMCQKVKINHKCRLLKAEYFKIGQYDLDQTSGNWKDYGNPNQYAESKIIENVR